MNSIVRKPALCSVYPDCGGLQADMMVYSCSEKNDIFVVIGYRRVCRLEERTSYIDA